MKLALVLSDLGGGGAQRVFLELARGFVAAGVDVDVVTFSGGPLADQVPAGAQWVPLGQGRVVRGAPAFARYLRQQRPDVLVSALNHVNVLSVAVARSLRNRPVVVVTHHNHLSTAARHKERRRDRAMPRALRVAYAAADHVVAVSGGVADDLARTTGLARSRIDVIFNPVRFDALVAAGEEPTGHRWADAKDAPLIVASGRLVDQKDFPTLLRAVARLDEHRLIVLGEGPRRSDLERLAADLGVDGRVHFPGFVENPFSYYRRADVFALSSRWEGLPTVLVEALAFPLNIVATDCPAGPAEILAGGRWGRLVPPGDVDALAAALHDAALDAPPSRAEAMTPYDPAVVVARYLALVGKRS